MAPEAHPTSVAPAARPGTGSGALAFERVLAPPGWLAPVQFAVGLAGLAGAVWSVIALHDGFGPLVGAAAALACAMLLTLGAVRARTAHRSVVLRVDGDGRAQVDVDGRPHDCIAHRWRLADRWVTLALRLDDGTPRTLSVVAADQGSVESWRRLRVWLHWLARGPHGARAAASRRRWRRAAIRAPASNTARRPRRTQSAMTEGGGKAG